jgi:hypothetical protein
MSDRQGGAALIVALLTAGLLAALGVSVLMSADVERQMAGNAAFSAQALAAAEAAIARGVIDLRASDDWTPFLNGAAVSTFTEASARVSLPAGGTLDLAEVTADLQQQSSGSGANAPTWRLLAWGPMSKLAPEGTIDSLQYLAVWVADDAAETDGNPQADENGMVTLRGEARGPGGSRRVVEVAVERMHAGVVRVTAWTEVR